MSSSSSSAESKDSNTEVFQRLPSSVIPSSYHLTLTPDLTKFTFNGQVTIRVSIKSPTDKIVLNSVEIEVQKASIKQKDGGKEEASKSIEYTKKQESVTITFSSSFANGEYDLVLTYTGILNDQMKGFYRSAYKDLKGETKYLACTQFESTDARRALPCFDEPALKAIFYVTLIVPEGLTALSNMPIVNEKKAEKVEKHIEYQFAPSPIMSTYLLAFVVGEFEYLETKSEGVLIRCYSCPGKRDQGAFALDVAKRVLPFYNKYFEIAYPLPKLDMIALPDFAAGAMENFGLVTYREGALLLDPINSSVQTKQWIALVVCHEIAHQWFGNITTMEWWTDLWLNEGFATWLENYATDHLFPNWDTWSQYVYSDLNTALSLDALHNSHPIQVTVHHPDEVDEIFDSISYSKGSVVIRMLENYLSAEVFRQGMCKYLKKYEYKNAKTEDLWDTLQEHSGKPVAAVMESWTKHTGFPLITIEGEGKVSADGTSVEYKVSQRRFIQTGEKDEKGTTWKVPISFLVAGEKEPTGQQLLEGKEGVLTLKLKEKGKVPAWVKLNAYQTSLYRVLYTAPMLQSLKEAIISSTSSTSSSSSSTLSPSDRLGIQNDLFALARAGLIPTTTVLDFILSYANETDYTCLADLIANLNEIGTLLKLTPMYDSFSSFVRSLLKKVVEEIGWEKKESDQHVTALLRSKVIATSLKYGDEKLKKEAIERFLKFYQLSSSTASSSSSKTTRDSSVETSLASILIPDLRGSVYSSVVSQGGLLAYEIMLQQASTTDLQEEKLRYFMSLGSSTDPSLLLRTLELSLSSTIRLQDSASLITAVFSNRVGLELVWKYFMNNWDKMLKRFGDSFGIGRIVAIVGLFAKEETANEAEEFFKKVETPQAERACKQAIEQCRSNAKWLKRDGAAIEAWLKKYESENKK